uniref:Uncharacterized protein n=1 Tax=Rhizophora mucronata TaxID=61149 RepID=A0A2P2P4B5_RHIMU
MSKPSAWLPILCHKFIDEHPFMFPQLNIQNYVNLSWSLWLNFAFVQNSLQASAKSKH